jgi:hypothetical protein
VVPSSILDSPERLRYTLTGSPRAAPQTHAKEKPAGLMQGGGLLWFFAL